MDTSSEAASVQAQIYRKLTGTERLLIAFDMSNSVRELAILRLRMEHPEYGESDLRRLYVRSLLGVRYDD